MNKLIFFLTVSLSCSQFMYALVDFSKSDRELRRELYALYQADHDFYKKDTCPYLDDVEYWIAVLKSHSRFLNQKIKEQRSCLKSGSFKDGLLCLSPLIGSLISLGLFFYSKNFNYIFLPGFYLASLFPNKNNRSFWGTLLPDQNGCGLGFVVTKRGFVRFAKAVHYILNGDYISKQNDRLRRDMQLLTIFQKLEKHT